MHELGIAQEIVSIAMERAGARKVRRVVVAIGRLTAVLPDAVRFCFDACTEGTTVAGATLEIIEVPGRGRCRACDAEHTLDFAFGICTCGHTEFEWLAGEELQVRSVEVH